MIWIGRQLTLMRSGCDFEVLAQSATRFWSQEPKNLSENLSETGPYSRRLLTGLSKRLKKAAAEIRELNSRPIPGGITPLWLVEWYGAGTGGLAPDDPAVIAAEFQRLPDLMEEYASFVLLWPHREYRKLISGRNSARNFHLSILCLYVSGITGRPNYAGIA